jgi:chaperonin GroES
MSNTYMMPLNDRVVVEKKPLAKQSKGGIFLPNGDDSEGLATGKVIAVGPGRYTMYGNRIPPSVQAGDVVLFDYHVGRSFKDTKYPDKEMIIISESDLFCKLEAHND